MAKTKKSSKVIAKTKSSTKSKVSSKNKISGLGKAWRIMLAIMVPLDGGVIISLFTQDTMMKFGQFNQPPLAPPAILFPIAWTLLYTLMGLASFYIWYKAFKSGDKKLQKDGKIALTLYGVQLVMNFIWTPLFFSLGLYWFAFAWLLVMWTLILVLMIKTYKIYKPAFFMLLPYLLWCTFAAYLNCGIAILN